MNCDFRSCHRFLCCGCSLCRRCCGSVGSGLCSAQQIIDILPFLAYYHHIGQHGNLVAFVVKYSKHGALYLGFFFKRCLVGFIGKEDIPYCHLVTFVLLEFRENAALNGLPLLGHNYNGSHKLLS